MRRLITTLAPLAALAACTVTLPPVLLTGTWRTTTLPDGGTAFEAEITSVTPLDGGTPAPDAGTPPPPTAADLTLDLGNPQQTIKAWEATAQAGQFGCPAGFPIDEVLRRSVTDLGITRIRVEARSGNQNDQDYWQAFHDGSIDFNTYKQYWYAPVNNAPIWFGEVDHQMDTVVVPMRQHGAVDIILTYVDFDPWTGWSHRWAPQEYVEFIQANINHLQAKYGITPQGVEVILEHDLAQWAPTEIQSVVTALRAALPPSVDVMAPSSSDTARALADWQHVQGADVLVYHRYHNDTTANLTALGQLGTRTAMLEFITAGYDHLYTDLTLANVEAFQMFAMAYCDDGSDQGYNYWVVDPNTNAVRLGQRSRMFPQVFKYVRPGAVRYPVMGTVPNGTRMMGFQNSDGTRVFVVDATAATVIEMGSGAWSASYTAWSGGDETVIPMAGGTAVHVPEAGVVTVYEPAP